MIATLCELEDETVRGRPATLVWNQLWVGIKILKKKKNKAQNSRDSNLNIKKHVDFRHHITPYFI